MFKSYLITFLRKLKREKLFSFLNIGGLTIGLTTVILISLFIRDELSYDQFQSRKESVFLLWHEVGKNASKGARVPYRLASEMKESIPLFEEVVSTQNRSVLVSNGEKSFYDNSAIYTTPGIFDLFDVNLISGDYPDLERPDVAIVSEKAALKYFERVEDAIGQTIRVDEKNSYIVSGIFENLKANSSIQFDFLFSGKSYFDSRSARIDSERGYYPTMNWVLLSPDHDIDLARSQMAKVIEGSMFEWLYNLSSIEKPFHLLNLTDLHLRSGLDSATLGSSDIRYVYLFTAIGVLILLIAIINYTNLSTAQSIKKSKEVGLRKVVGASTNQVSRYYLLESLVLVFISSLIAFAIAERCLPYLNSLMDKEIVLDYLSIEFFAITFGITLIIGIAAGLYPAFILSRSKPLVALNNQRSSKGMIKKGLMVTQFFIAQLLIIATVIIQHQLSYIQNKNLGYDREHLLEINTHGEFNDDAAVLKAEVLKISGVKEASLSNNTINRQDLVFLNNESIESDLDINIVFDFYNADRDFIKSMGMKVVQGRGFADQDTKGLLINESAYKAFGWDSFEGKTVKAWGNEYPVIGVIQDFHGESLKSEIRPTGVALQKDVSSFLVTRLNPTNIKETVTTMEELWGSFNTGRPLDYKFLDQEFDSNYKTESRLGSLFLSFAGLAIFIALLGLMGLSTFTIEQRVKEISLRRVLGANFRQVFSLFAKGYLGMIFIGFLMAAPIVYYSIIDWLEQFVYRIEPGPFEFISAIGLTTVLVLVIVSLQVVRANKFNPAQVLRNE
ncbi:hypothetical protein BFP97_07545 [Roseivirga sp. 4D4]|uniref:ABC transporter permease n=1 Tax=Roseivirga sp. 4D4 TaxID=1889784 RepID=UPI000852FF2E|nr:ABC transporter permease [Roseivirga sp. 4D4]OEK01379.1 hypothetical protein BFP97_07545 [Roseivirga sp. 4D4]